MITDAKLSHKFWQDAVATANYIHNRLPHKGNIIKNFHKNYYIMKR